MIIPNHHYYLSCLGSVCTGGPPNAFPTGLGLHTIKESRYEYLVEEYHQKLWPKGPPQSYIIHNLNYIQFDNTKPPETYIIPCGSKPPKRIQLVGNPNEIPLFTFHDDPKSRTVQDIRNHILPVFPHPQMPPITPSNPKTDPFDADWLSRTALDLLG